MTDTAQPIQVVQGRDNQDLNDGSSDQSAKQSKESTGLSNRTIQSQGVPEPLSLAPQELKTQADTENLKGDKQQSGRPSKVDRFDPNFTQNVINAAGPRTAPRLRQVMASLIRHIHDFARENEITVDEWMTGVEMVKLQIPPTAT